MSLSETYEKVKPSIVAFTQKYSIVTDPETVTEAQLSFPPIVGTGFIVDENGVIATNDHVAAELNKTIDLPPIPKGECIYQATIFRITDKGLVQIPLDILQTYQPRGFKTGKAYLGPKKPDIAFVVAKAKGLPTLELHASELQEGIEVASAGYPMGTDALVAPGWLHQITPTLQKGIVSAVLPYQQAFPHAYAVNIMIQGGGSGSPVFLPHNGKVIGIIHGSLQDYNIDKEEGVYKIPTNISYATPSYHISNFFKEVKAQGGFELPKDTQTLDDLLANTKQEVVLPHQPRVRITRVDL